MEAHVYEQFARLHERHFWFQGRRSIFFDLIERALRADHQARRDLDVLEIGCGPGGMLAPLSSYGKVVGLDIATEYLQHCKSRGFDRVVSGSGYELPFRDQCFDLVALFDTIEHIPDDQRVLANVRRVLKPGGHVFISVPAYQFLYSQNDRVVHHQRRYTKTSLAKVIRQAGLTVQKVSYFNTFLFPLILPAVLVLKLKEKLVGLPEGQTNLNHEFIGPVNKAFSFTMSSERFWLRHMDFPFGHSLLAMAG